MQTLISQTLPKLTIPRSQPQATAHLAKLSNNQGVLTATVISSALLKTSQQPTTSSSSNIYSTTILVGKERLTINLDQPLLRGTTLALKADSKAVQIISVAPPTQNSDKTTNNPAPAAQQLLRTALPQQQPIKNLLPILISTLQHAKQLPPVVSQQALKLLASFPTAEKLSSPQGLKHSIQSSGIMLESQLQNLSKQISAKEQPTAASPASIQAVLKNDSKALNQQLLAMVIRLQQQRASQTPRLNTQQASTSTTSTLFAANVTPTPSSTTDNKTNLAPITSSTHTIPASLTTNSTISTPNRITVTEQPQTSNTQSTKTPYQGEYLPHQLPASATHGTVTSKASQKENLDILLKQLSQQLVASLARTQTHQLEALSNRQNLNGEAGTNLQQWSLELPIINGRHIDNLQLVIAQQKAPPQDKQLQKRWLVTLNFDLHQLGTLNVELSIIGKSVSANLWAAKQATLDKIKRELESLKQGLEDAGVTVRSLDCKVGTPTCKGQLKTQLVDTHS